MKIPIDQLKEVITYLERIAITPDTVPVFKYRVKERSMPVTFKTDYPVTGPMPDELTFEYSFRFRQWELKI